MTALYAARNTSHSSGFDKSNVPTLSVSQFIPSTIRAISQDPRDNTRARSADMYEIPAPDFCGANTRCSASSPGAPLTGGADFLVEAPPAFLSEIHHDHVHQRLLLRAQSNCTGKSECRTEKLTKKSCQMFL